MIGAYLAHTPKITSIAIGGVGWAEDGSSDGRRRGVRRTAATAAMPASWRVGRPMRVHGSVPGVRVEARVELGLEGRRWMAGRTSEPGVLAQGCGPGHYGLRVSLAVTAYGRRADVGPAQCAGAAPTGDVARGARSGVPAHNHFNVPHFDRFKLKNFELIVQNRQIRKL
jgi:hypothetical protein